MYCLGSAILPLCLSKKFNLWAVMYYSSGIFNLYPFSAAILFICVGAMVVEMYEYTAAHLLEPHCNQLCTVAVWKVKFIKFKKNCLLIIELVNQINQCFSLFLFVFITSLFARMITQSFHLMTSVWKYDWLTSAGVLLQLLVDFTHFFVLLYTCYRVRLKVRI